MDEPQRFGERILREARNMRLKLPRTREAIGQDEFGMFWLDGEVLRFDVLNTLLSTEVGVKLDSVLKRDLRQHIDEQRAKGITFTAIITNVRVYYNICNSLLAVMTRDEAIEYTDETRARH